MTTSGPQLPLNALELGALYDMYQIKSLIRQMYRVFTDNVQDDDIAQFVRWRYEQNTKECNRIQQIYGAEAEGPRGLTEEDIYTSKPQLYTDGFYLYYSKGWVRAAFVGSACRPGGTA